MSSLLTKPLVQHHLSRVRPVQLRDPSSSETFHYAWLFRYFRIIWFAEERLCTRGCACSATRTKLLGFEATSCGVLYGAWRSGPSGGSISRIRTREPTNSDLTIRALRGSGLDRAINTSVQVAEIQCLPRHDYIFYLQTSH